jgi:hypothetical protein
MDTVSYSEIKLARKCAKAHDYRYGQRLRRKKPNRPQLVGTILHEMLDAYTRLRMDHNYPTSPWDVWKKYRKEFKKLFLGEKEEYGDIPKVTKAVFEGYLRRWKNDGLVYIASEVEVIVPFTKKLHLKAVIDKVVQDKDGRRFLMDHKFHKTIPGPDDRFSDIQTVLYFWAWNEAHDPLDKVDGIIWDYGRMKAPTLPELLKNGALSQRSNIDTDWFTYYGEIKRLGLEERPYQKMKTLLAGKERTFFERVPLPGPSKKLVSMVVQDARTTALEARRRAAKGNAPREMSGFNCNGCEFRRLCEAEVRGLDAKFVRKRDYEVRPPHGENKYGKDIEPEEKAA